jgi:hypothetical protein
VDWSGFGMVHDVVFYRLVHLIPEKLRKSLWRGQQRHGMVVWPGTGASNMGTRSSRICVLVVRRADGSVDGTADGAL